MWYKNTLLVFLLLLPLISLSQEVSLFQQFNGRYDYKAFGNTLNLAENGTGAPCEILTESSADFSLDPSQTLIAAYLYWAGSASQPDLEVVLNGTPVTAERDFNVLFNSNGEEFPYFAAYADVTAIVSANGNATYTLSELDLSSFIQTYCDANSTNFGGWAITVIYEDPLLNLNQVSIFDGLEFVGASNNNLNITLENLNVIDNIGAKIGFLAWEGDAGIANNESLRINGNLLSNPPLNPANNAFNGTNSFTNSDVLYNMDIDVYDIENNIAPGDPTAQIQLTSDQDFVMVNNIITVLNTELPDATIQIDSATGGTVCGDREIIVEYTVFNTNSTDLLPAGTPIAFYANAILAGQTATLADIPIDGMESNTITLTIPNAVGAEFDLLAVVDDQGNGVGIVNELDETNNEDTIAFELLVFPIIDTLLDLEQCDVVGVETFDLSEATINVDPTEGNLTFHLSQEDADNNLNPITSIDNFLPTENPQTIFVRVDNGDCFTVDSFVLTIEECPLPDATATIDNELNACRGRTFRVEYTIYNLLGTAVLPAQTSIAFYIDNQLLAETQTINSIPIGGEEMGSIELDLADTVPDLFDLMIVVDHFTEVEELDESNNDDIQSGMFNSIPPILDLPDMIQCDEGFDSATFDLTLQDDLISEDPNDVITYHLTLEDAFSGVNSILDPESFVSTTDPQIIYVRQENEICFANSSFILSTENCPPEIPEGISPNGDGLNDVFKIVGLINIFLDFELKIYSREGNLIYQGGNENGLWDCIPNTGVWNPQKIVPTGTYYYVLYLNDIEYPTPYVGWVYVNF
ncbi:MAG: hypothetical protein HKM28_02520 [Flavobacteriaceae bacterium]|nr:hypothetical protein [Flavobacteriaceae bacterium]